jgi:hypothetical protein
MKKRLDYQIGSGNVFADLGLSNPEERLAKADAMSAIIQVIRSRGLDSVSPHLEPGELEFITVGRGSKFSLDRLLDIVRALDGAADVPPTSGRT